MSISLTHASANRSLLKLAPEIRHRIYETVFGFERVAVEADLEGFSVDEDPQERDIFIRPLHRSTQLLRTCRIILQEALPVLLHHTVFVVNRLASPFFLPYRRSTQNPDLCLLRHLEVDIAVQDLYRILYFDFWREQFLRHLQTLKIKCCCGMWVRGTLDDTISWRDQDLEGYEDVYTEARKLVMDIWLEAQFTHLEDESVDNEMMEFHLWRDKGTQLTV